ncbi:hypothetical protein ACO0LB_02380 [Undibacterium sp. SXout7W]|uniref:hypothetical protein n=1 Tax=Undibacterium sp. SXout7W TaxID=3413049 RepID=UPI003BF2B8FB
MYAYAHVSLVRIFLAAAILIAVVTPTSASPLLKCIVSYAGTPQTITAHPEINPYLIDAVDIGERFTFKAVMIGKENNIDYIKLYVYFQTRRNDVPIHQASYLPPFVFSEEGVMLTPKNYLYAGDVERALEYQCSLQKVVN